MYQAQRKKFGEALFPSKRRITYLRRRRFQCFLTVRSERNRISQRWETFKDYNDNFCCILMFSNIFKGWKIHYLQDYFFPFQHPSMSRPSMDESSYNHSTSYFHFRDACEIKRTNVRLGLPLGMTT